MIHSRYYRLIHPILPILPCKDRLKLNLSKAPRVISNALNSTLKALVRLPTSDMNSDLKGATEQVMALRNEDFTTRPTSDQLLYLQALLLMSLATDCHDPIYQSQSEWLQAIFDTFQNLNLPSDGPCEHIVGSDPDTDTKLCRRAWVVLMIMDRWQAQSNYSNHVTRASNVTLYDQDLVLLGNDVYYFARK